MFKRPDASDTRRLRFQGNAADDVLQAELAQVEADAYQVTALITFTTTLAVKPRGWQVHSGNQMQEMGQ